MWETERPRDEGEYVPSYILQGAYGFQPCPRVGTRADALAYDGASRHSCDRASTAIFRSVLFAFSIRPQRALPISSSSECGGSSPAFVRPNAFEGLGVLVLEAAEDRVDRQVWLIPREKMDEWKFPNWWPSALVRKINHFEVLEADGLDIGDTARVKMEARRE